MELVGCEDDEARSHEALTSLVVHANQAMQEPLEKLYKYENQPDIREKVREYISELDKEIERCHHLAEQNMNDEATTVAEMMVVRVQTLNEVRKDLQSRLEELI